MRWLLPLGLLILATALEAGGDALVRIGLRPGEAGTRALLMGAYVATFFVMGQLIAWAVFHTAPTLPVLGGGALIVRGGAIVTLWQG